LTRSATARPIRPIDLGATRHVAIVGPGGYGKTTLLADLKRTHNGTTTTLDDLPEQDRHDDVLLLVDDAHRLDDIRLAEISLLADRGCRVVLAARPWPHSTALRELITTLSDGAPPLLLSALDPTQSARLLKSAFGLTEDVARSLHDYTGGVPRFLERVAAVSPDDEARQARVLEPFRAELATLDDDVLRFLIAAEADVGHDLGLLTELLWCNRSRVSEVIEAARATGMTVSDGTLLPIVRHAVTALSPVDRRLDVLQRTVEIRLRQRQPVLGPARSLLGTRSSGVVAPVVFDTAAREALPDDPALAARLFAAAVEGGSLLSTVAADWAVAAASAGDLSTALQVSETLLSSNDPAQREAGATVAATVLAHRGELARSAELFQWAARGSAPAFAAVALIGTGRHAAATKLMESGTQADRAPTLLSGVATRMARGIEQSVTATAADAVTTLMGAAAMAEPAAGTALLPDSPAALAAIVGLHAGELGLAESVLDRALAGDVPLLDTRHRLLRGWVALVCGDLDVAAAHLDAVRRRRRELEPRDELFAAALAVGLARRHSDLPGLRAAWGPAYQALARHPVDLFVLLPLGELVIAASRLGEQAKIGSHLTRARALLGELGDPSLWSVSMLWNSLHAAITTDDRAEVERMLALLGEHGGYSKYCATLLRTGQSWLAVLTRDIDARRVGEAAGALHGVGLRWEAARLAGQAAIRTPDRAAMVSLLEVARQYQNRPGRRPRRTGKQAAPVAGTVPAAPVTAAGFDSTGLDALSDREREVAQLVLEGLTYKQIGGQLFISGKTVEHHVAKTRSKLGVTNRRELIARLRALLSDEY
jgi:DNA-binding CsgD family transcriptional regulator